MKVNIFITASNDGEFLDGVDSLGEMLHKTLKEANKQYPEDNNYSFLIEYLENNKVFDFDAWFHEEFPKHLTIINDFSKEINLYDAIYSDCLMSKTKMGKALIELLSYGDFKLVLTGRAWRTIDSLFLDFELVSCGIQFNPLKYLKST
ncbi:MAG: hypothetical protein JXR34_12925 [Bacteroidales bacterium]|nr:hypothetical protein [Bacteroidales bacterium]